MSDGRVTGLAGVLVFTSAERFDEMARFYRDVLAMPTRRDREHFVSFEWGEVRLTVTVHDGVEGRATDPLRTMVNLAVDDVSSMHERLTATGVTVIRPPEREQWGGVVCSLEDPDGNIVQLFQLAGSSPED